MSTVVTSGGERHATQRSHGPRPMSRVRCLFHSTGGFERDRERIRVRRATCRPLRCTRASAMRFCCTRTRTISVTRVGGFVREGGATGEPTLVVVGTRKIARLRDHLDGDAAGVHFADMGDVGSNPARIIPAWRRFVAEYSRLGTCCCAASVSRSTLREARTPWSSVSGTRSCERRLRGKPCVAAPVSV